MNELDQKIKYLKQLNGHINHTGRLAKQAAEWKNHDVIILVLPKAKKGEN